MASSSPRESVELFHLVLLRALSSGPDKARLILKGGCNLRFFFGSRRYSEDMDLDVLGIPRETLKNKVDRLLESPLVLQPLRSRGIEVTERSAPKQTETTQRWKLGLRFPNQSLPLRTKVEFSRRKTGEGAMLGPVSAELLRLHSLPVILVNHYRIDAAVAQKVAALAHRMETQARDVYDLHVLFSRPETVSFLDPEARRDLPKAIDRALSLSFDEFKGQVVAYLPAEEQPLHDKDHWNQLQLTVVERLQELGQ